MTRRTYRKPHVTVSLFPFLAVLVCTMGALIVLLVLVVQQARVQATVVDAGPTAEELAAAENLDLARQDLEWRREILEQQRLEMTKKQSDQRLQLSHLEDHIRRLEEKWQQLQAAAAQLETSAGLDEESRQVASAELAALQTKIDQAKQQLEAARQEADKRQRSFAIIPYRGPHGTQRRPIFIECTARGIILQPEGLVITAEDLLGPLGPGNPLDAALRATREYLVNNGVVGAAGEPYPLLVVRPDGTAAYGAARNAMKTWDDEFGYELIEEDVKLEYPAADPMLRELIVKSLADARQRQEILAAAMPSQFGGRSRNGGGGMSGGFSGGFPGGSGTGRRSGGGGLAPQQASIGGRYGQQNGLSSSNADGGQNGAGDLAGSSTTGSSTTGSSTSPTDSQVGQADTGNGGPASQGQANQAGQPGNPLRGGNSSSSGGQVGSAGTGGTSFSAAMQNARGKDWALPPGARHATGITRPVRVACWPDRLLILPDQGDPRNARTIKIDQKNGLAGQLNDFVDAIWKHTEGWGLALAGGYWKPVVNVEVAPGGEVMYDELERLMAGSGLEVKRKSW